MPQKERPHGDDEDDDEDETKEETPEEDKKRPRGDKDLQCATLTYAALFYSHIVIAILDFSSRLNHLNKVVKTAVCV